MKGGNSVERKCKFIKIFIIVIAIAIVLGIYNVITSYLFQKDNIIKNGKAEVIEHIKSIDNTAERKKQIDFSVQENIITSQDADELY